MIEDVIRDELAPLAPRTMLFTVSGYFCPAL